MSKLTAYWISHDEETYVRLGTYDHLAAFREDEGCLWADLLDRGVQPPDDGLIVLSNKELRARDYARRGRIVLSPEEES